MIPVIEQLALLSLPAHNRVSPLKYLKDNYPESSNSVEKKLSKESNPPNFKVKFFKEQDNIKNINCYSNEGNIWRKSEIKFISETEILIMLKEKFKSERGRINCSLWEEKGKWR